MGGAIYGFHIFFVVFFHVGGSPSRKKVSAHGGPCAITRRQLLIAS
jgi:hypothetical protein